MYKVHLISWCLFITYEVLVAGVLYGKFSSFWDYFVHYAINIALFYTHAVLVLPAVFQRQRAALYWLMPLLVAGEVATFIAITFGAESFITQYLHVQLTRPLQFDFTYCFRSLWRAVYFMGFATGYYFLNNYIKERERADHSEQERLLHIIETQHLQHELVKSQNAFLKAQINPHFLFNSLNFVYNSVRKTSTQAAEVILSLSQMMRYALQSEDEYQEIDLLEEIEHAESLIHIHQIRHNHQLQLKMTYGENMRDIKFIPLILITLVENIFKHGDLMRDNHQALVDILFQDNVLTICTSNLMKQDRPAGHRIGLDNIQGRLENVYKGRFSFEAHADEKGYFHTALRVSNPNSLFPGTVSQK